MADDPSRPGRDALPETPPTSPPAMGHFRPELDKSPSRDQLPELNQLPELDRLPVRIQRSDPVQPSDFDPESGLAPETAYEITLRRVDVGRPGLPVIPAGPKPVDPPPVSESSRLAQNPAAIGTPSEIHAVAPPSGSKPAKRKKNRNPDPLTQSLVLLATMAMLLLAARFVVPQIVEEIRYAWHRGELRAEYESGTEGLRNVSLDTLSDAYQMVNAAVGPSVVHIDVQRRLPIKDANVASLLGPRLTPSPDQGSGVVVDAAGYVLTNRHVIADGEDITVTLSDGRRVSAVVAGTDPLTDLALLKIDSDRLIPIVWGDSDRCRVGSPVWAVGSPFGLDRTVTFGILSGKHRMVRASTQYQDFMQSDVAVNPGNSGGPLVDARGTLVGINTAIVGDTYQGVSFSIPSNVVKQVYHRLRDFGRVERGFLGVLLGEVPDEQLTGDNARIRGAMITQVPALDSPAATAGLVAGDVILAVDGHLARDKTHLMQLIGQSESGTRVSLKIHREGEPLDIAVVLGMRPEMLDRH
ncbi:Putative serine protease HtrA [Rubripirellula lacrimiformis]|uniref:Serine protease HtrA n=1 Tax=Rubripirellula lacrimiformis TaxID=1930273 RepID=A0A517N6B4_9BACT|nr:trypsin-like peptidase domain-containing protein [Rubripirellula lacrimiformis]QDT02548.1 Putative serine protease HtrA [Rubripirellula lacrimiformis]